MGLFERIRSNLEIWKIEKYTKRRHLNTPEFEQRDREFYRENYKDGVYLHQQPGATLPSPSNSIKRSLSRRTTLLKTKNEKILRSSEIYNSN